MIKGIDQAVCTKCRLCESICPTDVFLYNNEKDVVEIAYPDDCFNCFECYSICAVEALSFVPSAPSRFNVKKRWEQIKAEFAKEYQK